VSKLSASEAPNNDTKRTAPCAVTNAEGGERFLERDELRERGYNGNAPHATAVWQSRTGS